MCSDAVPFEVRAAQVQAAGGYIAQYHDSRWAWMVDMKFEYK